MARESLTESGAAVLSSSFQQLLDRLLAIAWSRAHFANERFFSRGGPLSPELVMTLLLFMSGDAGRRGYAQLLDEFWEQAGKAGIDLPVAEPVSAAAFCLARKKLLPSLFDTMLRLAAEDFTSSHPQECRWRGRRVLAVDGMKCNLQRSEELWTYFGMPEGAHAPQALVSMLFDVTAKLPIALRVAPYASSERHELLELRDHLQVGDVVVLDRGYPSFEVVDRLLEAGVDFVMRVPMSHSFEAIDAFRESGGQDYRVFLRPTRAATSQTPRELRVVRVDCGGEEPWIILTSLRRKDFSRSAIGQLYHMRWEVEEFFKLEKSDYFSLGQLHAKSVLGVQQEIRAQALFAALARVMLAEASLRHGMPYVESSQKSAMLTLASNLVALLLLDDADASAALLETALRRAVRLRHRKRSRRSYPRRSFKPGPRWNARGRIGA